jgi:hypothetical protein
MGHAFGGFYMKDDNFGSDKRKKHNEQLIRRMKSGEPLWSYDSKASWFPPRPIIEKDPEAIKRLYQDGVSAPASVYSDPTVRHIERQLKLVSPPAGSSKSDKVS